MYFASSSLPMVVEACDLGTPAPENTYPNVELKVALFPHLKEGGSLSWSVALEFADTHDPELRFAYDAHPTGHVFFDHGTNLLLQREDWDDAQEHVVHEALEVMSWN